jgi:acyl-CoA thioesterase-1
MGWTLFILIVLVGWLALRLSPVFGHPHLSQLARFESSLSADPEKVVVCFGDSLTEGNASFDYVSRLAGRLEPSGHTVLNAGINGQLAWNLRMRVDEITRIDPAYIVLLVGTNDVRAIENEVAASQYVKEQSLPETPSPEFWQDNYRQLLDVLCHETRSRVILVTLPMLGEREGEAVDAYVQRANQLIEQEARTRDLPCVPLYARLTSMLDPDARARAPTYAAQYSRRLAVRAVLLHYLLGMSWDRITGRNGMSLLTDMIHLNETSGEVLVELVEAAILDNPGRRTREGD